MPSPVHVPEPTYSSDGSAPIELKMLLRTEQTEGSLALFEETTAPNAGPPLHAHLDADEFFRVIDGSYRFQAGEQVIDAGPGDSLFVPRGTPHCFCNVGQTPGRLFMGFTPGGAEALFDWLEENGMPTPDDVAMIRERYATEFLGPNPFVQD